MFPMLPSRQLPCRPYPEALKGKRGGKWDVDLLTSYQGRTQVGAHQMRVPGMADCEALKIRLHELLHAAITPPQNPDTLAAKHHVSELMLQAAEDARLNRVAARSEALCKEHQQIYASVDLDLNRITEALVALFRQPDLSQAFRSTLATLACTAGTDNAAALRDALRERLEAMGLVEQLGHHQVRALLNYAAVAVAWAFGNKRTPTFVDTITLARLLDSQAAKGLGKGEAKGDRPGEQSFIPGTGRAPIMDTDGRWGPMAMELIPLEEDADIRARLRTYRDIDHGTQIGQLPRLLTDQRVFREVLPAIVGTILIDCSGSMGITADQIKAMVRIAPAATVALYSAVRGADTHGMLRVVARRGRIARTPEAYQMGSGNVVDGPALEWLGQQTPPRIWVSDGGVTGVGDDLYTNLSLESLALTIRHRIRRVNDPEDAAQTILHLNQLLRRKGASMS